MGCGQINVICYKRQDVGDKYINTDGQGRHNLHLGVVDKGIQNVTDIHININDKIKWNVIGVHVNIDGQKDKNRSSTYL